jgi:threonine/homoserine/homoserine lactone efflux protein
VPDALTSLLFLLAALVIAVTPGPGILYIAARTMAGGRRAGFASSVGTGLGGLVHVAAVTIGMSAAMLASAEIFTAVKLAGSAYLVWLGLKMVRQARLDWPIQAAEADPRRAFRDGIVVEALNPKTAAFFLALLPQFVDASRGSVALQLLVLGGISVVLNTSADLVVVMMTAAARDALVRRPRLIRRLRQGAGSLLCALGVSLAFARQPT